MPDVIVDAHVVSLFRGADPRCEKLLEELVDVINARGVGLAVPSVIGVLRLLEHSLIQGRTV